MSEFRQRLSFVEGAVGMAAAIGGKVVTIDLFDKATTCQKVWGRLLTGLVMDALAAEAATPPAPEEVERLVEGTATLAWAPAPAIGEGEEYRTETEDGKYGSALALHEAVVHASVTAP